MSKFVKVSGLKEFQRELKEFIHEVKQLNGNHSIAETRQKLKRLGLKDSDISSIMDSLTQGPAQLDDNLIHKLAQHNTLEQFEATIRKDNPNASEEEIQQALEKFRSAKR